MILPNLRKSAIGFLVKRYQPASGAKTKLHTCIFKVDRLGDFILSVGAIRQIMERFGESNCALVVYDIVADLAKMEFPSATVIAMSAPDGSLRESFKLYFECVRRLDAFSFENLICLRHQRTLFHDLALTRIKAQHSFAIANETFGRPGCDQEIYQFSFETTIERPKTAPKELSLEQEAHRVLLNYIFNCELSPEAVLPRLQFVKPAPGEEIAITPFSSTAIRNYPTEQLLNVLVELREKIDSSFYLCGGPLEKFRLERLQEAARAKGIDDIHVRASDSFVEFAHFIASVHAVLTMDTSTAHLATALDKPTVVVLGGGHYGHFGPWYSSTKQVWLTNLLPCFGCGWLCIHPTAICISEIPATTITACLLKVMPDTPDGDRLN